MADEDVTQSDDTRIDVFDDPPTEPEKAEAEKGEESEEVAQAEGIEAIAAESPGANADAEDTGEPEKDAAPEPPSDIEKRIAGLEAAAAAERKKRQAAEEQLNKLKAKEEAPDPLEDPEGFAAYQEQQAFQTNVNVSRRYAMRHLDDYEEKEAEFVRRAQLDATLVAEMNESEDPAMFAYEKGKAFLEAAMYTDPEARKAHDEAVAKVATEPLEKRIAELEKLLKPGDETVSATDLPDLTRATSAGSNTLKQARPVETIAGVFGDED